MAAKKLGVNNGHTHSPESIKQLPGPVAQLVVSPTADPGVASSVLARSHTFREIDHHEIVATVSFSSFS